MKENELWYKKILKKTGKKIIYSAAFVVVFTISISLWHLFTGKSFEWQSIAPVEEPGLLPRLFYSALVYVTFGAFLYATGFYKFLYSAYKGTRNGWRAYRQAKGIIWLLLILVMYFIIVPIVVDVLNVVISFSYNIFMLLIYLFPSISISAVVFAAGYFVLGKYRGK